jgi:hypothetical protein
VPQAVKSMAATMTMLTTDHKMRCVFIILLLKFRSEWDLRGK